MLQPPSASATAIPYSPHEAGRLLFAANRFSQGRTDGVNKMLDYALCHLDWQPQQISVAEVVNAVRARVTAFVGNSAIHLRVDADEAEDMLKQQAEKLKLHADSRTDAERALQQCARHIVAMDASYLTSPVGRPRSGKQGDVSEYHDPWLSHVCHFGIAAAPTGHPIFDTMFAQMRPHLLGSTQLQRTFFTAVEAAKIRQIVTLHNEHHATGHIQLSDIPVAATPSSFPG